MSRGIYARLPDMGREALYDLADHNWRDPRDEAARLIMEDLKRAGALPAEQSLTDSGLTAALEAVT